MTESDETAKGLFVRVLHIDSELAAVLVDSGFRSLEEIAYVPIGEFRSIGALQEQQIQTLRTRARKHLLTPEVSDDSDEGDSLSVTANKPRPRMPGGASAPIDNDEN